MSSGNKPGKETKPELKQEGQKAANSKTSKATAIDMLHRHKTPLQDPGDDGDPGYAVYGFSDLAKTI